MLREKCRGDAGDDTQVVVGAELGKTAGAEV